jgi:hypothetical protein
MDSQDSGVAHWHGTCDLPPDERSAVWAELMRAAKGEAAGSGT